MSLSTIGQLATTFGEIVGPGARRANIRAENQRAILNDKIDQLESIFNTQTLPEGLTPREAAERTAPILGQASINKIGEGVFSGSVRMSFGKTGLEPSGRTSLNKGIPVGAYNLNISGLTKTRPLTKDQRELQSWMRVSKILANVGDSSDPLAYYKAAEGITPVEFSAARRYVENNADDITSRRETAWRLGYLKKVESRQAQMSGKFRYEPSTKGEAVYRDKFFKLTLQKLEKYKNLNDEGKKDFLKKRFQKARAGNLSEGFNVETGEMVTRLMYLPEIQNERLKTIANAATLPRARSIVKNDMEQAPEDLSATKQVIAEASTSSPTQVAPRGGDAGLPSEILNELNRFDIEEYKNTVASYLRDNQNRRSSSLESRDRFIINLQKQRGIIVSQTDHAAILEFFEDLYDQAFPRYDYSPFAQRIF